MRFEVYQDRIGEWRWRLRAANNTDIIAVSSEGYSSEHNCLHSIGLVMDTNRSTPIFKTTS